MSKELKPKGNVSTLVIALIGMVGTIIAGLLGSPLLEKWFAHPPEATSTNPPSAILVFNEDFNDSVANGFYFDVGKWEIIKEKSNNVLAAYADTPSPDIQADALFGPADFSDGIIEFRIKFIQAGPAYLDFRSQDRQKYSLYLDPSGQQVILGYGSADSGWNMQYEPQSLQPFTFQLGIWYLLKLGAQGDKMTVYIDNNRVVSATDDRLTEGRLLFELDPASSIYIDDIKVWLFDR